MRYRGSARFLAVLGLLCGKSDGRVNSLLAHEQQGGSVKQRGLLQTEGAASWQDDPCMHVYSSLVACCLLQSGLTLQQTLPRPSTSAMRDASLQFGSESQSTGDSEQSSPRFCQDSSTPFSAVTECDRDTLPLCKALHTLALHVAAPVWGRRRCQHRHCKVILLRQLQLETSPWLQTERRSTLYVANVLQPMQS